ncbi:receptor-type tyrosine-protein phosphatase F [Elysia marginata]|uniref:Receptor-type tyrosine-protein phosphatase F n=1 Tax=Elysia marginata TaxID=1093978 RepID=A0AAV4GL45_9GAST|nr:receptor-type tyrosine-protein phosphatase F [Elysia marginata]
MYTTDRWKLQKQWQQKAAVSQNVKQQTFHGLPPETTYYFFVQAMTDLGFGPRSKVVSYTTPKGFVILYTQDLGGQDVHWQVESRLGQALRMAVIEGLEPDTAYNFKVQAHTSIGYGPESNTVLYKTPSAKDKIDLRPVEPPRNLRANILSSTSVVISWQDPGMARIYEEDREESICSATYTVRYRALDPEPSAFTQVTSPFPSLYLLDLEPLTRYEFSVKVHCQEKESPWSQPVANTTFAADFSQPPLIAEVHGRANSPDVAVLTWQPHLDSKIKEKKASHQLKVPEMLRVMIMSSSSAVVSWHDPSATRSMDKGGFERAGVPRTYTLRYRRINTRSPGHGGYKMIWPTFPSIFLLDLMPGSLYEFQVRVNRGFHHSEWSKVVVNRTLEAGETNLGNCSELSTLS